MSITVYLNHLSSDHQIYENSAKFICEKRSFETTLSEWESDTSSNESSHENEDPEKVEQPKIKNKKPNCLNF